ncbi:lanosterol synthase [Aspergillus affinis]|uniref:lanosterol synthase n=1 Tax=Aspergillus affinis TaxID=1070780 RepID=UPI0022FEC240|nr:lanosterol synthase [Aspergillus affinis]KAI9042986.1 lanosterol synthase [Aspergillus affinis]
MSSKYSLKIKNHVDRDQSDGTRPSYAKTTDTEGWHLVVTEDLGRMRWIYVNDEEERKARPQDATTKFFLHLPTGKYRAFPSQTWKSGMIAHLAIARVDAEPGPLPSVTMTSLRQTSKENLRLAVDNLLMIQNASGGYSSFEPIGAGAWLEHLNGTEMFGQVMTEHDYVEYTSSCITALELFRARNDDYRSQEVDTATERGVKFVESSQKEDGSWIASWGLTFTYGAFFAMEALHCGGRNYENSSVVREGCRFLLDMQESDGGWGETLDSRLTGSYVRAPRSHTVQTAWSCLALTHITYYYYIYSFPLRAMATYEKIYGEGSLL